MANTGNRKNSRKGKRKVSERVTAQLICAVVLVVLGCVLLACGFIAPPTGEIHSSILIAFGEILTFVGALFGVDYHYKYTSR